MNKRLYLYTVLIETLCTVILINGCPMHNKGVFVTNEATLNVSSQKLQPIAGILSLKQAKKRNLLHHHALPCCQSSIKNMSKKQTQKKLLSTISSKEKKEGISV